MGSNKSTSKTTSSQTTQPLAWQSDKIQDLYNTAQSLFGTQYSQATPNFNTYAGLNSDELSALGNATTDSGVQRANGNGLITAGNGLLSNASSGSTALNGATGLAGAGATGNFNHGTTQVSQNLMGSTGLTNMAGLTSLMNAVSGSGTDATAQNIADAKAYENSADVQNQIKAANAASDDLYQRTGVSNLNAQAVAGGNLNSSRAGAAQAIADSEQESRDATNATNILTNAYNTGLSTAEQAREANLSDSLSAAGTANYGSSLGLQAQNDANSQTNTNNALQQSYIGQLADDGNSLVNSANTGAGITSTGSSLVNNADSNALNAGSALQQNQQSQNDANLQATLSSNQYPWTLLQNLYGLIGSNSWGSQSNGTSTTSTTSTPSVGSMIQGGIGSLASLTSALTGSSSKSGGLLNLFSK